MAETSASEDTVGQALAAATFVEEQKLTGSDATNGVHFGFAIPQRVNLELAADVACVG
jgi:hypothetical protein